MTREATIQLLAENGSLTRAELARRIGVSRAAMSMTVSRLLEEGLVVESFSEGADDLRGESGTAPGVPLSLLPGAAGAVGVDFAHQGIRVVVADIAHNVLAEDSRELPLDYDAREAITLAANLVRDLLDESGMDSSRLLGVGVGVPGPVDQSEGCPTPSSISASWVGRPVAEELAEQIKLPVLLDNNVNLGALAEVVWGAGKGLSDVIYVKVSTGIGAGIVLDGRLWRGAAGMAGEIGHMTMDESGPMCRCGNRGCLEVYVGLAAQLDLLRPVFGAELTADKVLELAVGGDGRCRRVFADVGRALGQALANVCNIVNPAAIVLGGELTTVFDLVAGPVREAIGRYALHLAATSVQIVPSQLGARAEALGGVALVFHERSILEKSSRGTVHVAGAIHLDKLAEVSATKSSVASKATNS